MLTLSKVKDLCKHETIAGNAVIAYIKFNPVALSCIGCGYSGQNLSLAAIFGGISLIQLILPDGQADRSFDTDAKNDLLYKEIYASLKQSYRHYPK